MIHQIIHLNIGQQIVLKSTVQHVEHMIPIVRLSFYLIIVMHLYLLREL